MDIHKGKIDIEKIKRCYAEFHITIDCPDCGTSLHYDSDDYLDYPVEGETDTLAFYCEKCENHVLLPYKNFGAKLEIRIFRDKIRMD